MSHALLFNSSMLHGTRRTLAIWLMVLMGTISSLVAFTVTADATVLPSGGTAAAITGFELDGDGSATGGDTDGAGVSFDWDSIRGPGVGPYSFSSGGIDYSSSGIVDSTFNLDQGACGSDQLEDGFGDGAKVDDNPWPVGQWDVNHKSDGCSGGAAHEAVTVRDGAVDRVHHVLYLSWTRTPSATGDMTVYQVLEGSQTGRCDDYLVEFDYDSKGPGVTLDVLEWDGGCEVTSTGSWRSAQAPMSVAGRTGTNTATADLGAQDANEDTFGESAIDLTATGLLPEGVCTTFTSGGYLTRTGNSQNGALKDFFAFTSPLVIDNCSDDVVTDSEETGLVVAKAGAGDPDADFDFAVTDAPDTPYTLSLGESTDLIPFDGDTSVTITETLPNQAPGWLLTDVACRDGNDDEVAASVDLEAGSATVTTVDGQVVTCTFTNVQGGQINILKDGSPAGGGPFGFDTNYADNGVEPDGTPDFTLAIGDPAHKRSLAPGDYTIVELLDEANEAQDPDYALGSVECVVKSRGAGDSSFTTSVDDANAIVSLGAGDQVQCTFTNVQAGRLVVTKTTDGADGTFTFTGDVAGDITTTDATTAAGDELVVDLAPGTHAVGEAVPAGWDLATATCDNQTGSLADGEDTAELTGIEVGAGETVTCTFHNTRKTATLTLTKLWDDLSVANDSVTLVATGDDAHTDGPGSGSSVVDGETTPATVTIHPGEQVELAEAFDDGTVGGYDTFLACDPVDAGVLTHTGGDVTGSFTVPADPVDVTCTFTNQRLTGSLTLHKEWVSGHGGDTAELRLAATRASDPVDGVTSTSDGTVGAMVDTTATVSIQTLSGEQVDLSEVLGDDNVGTYETTLACVGGDGLTTADDARSGTYDVGAVPTDVTCTFTNVAQGSIEVTKQVTGVPDDFEWAFDIVVDGAREEIMATSGVGPSSDVVTFPSLALDQTFTVREPALPAGWEQAEVACSVVDADLQADGYQVAITDPGQAVTCDIVNTTTPTFEVAADVAITKTGTEQVTVQIPLVGDNDPTATWTLEVVNNGADVARDVVVTDPIPAGVADMAVTTDRGACVADEDGVRCELGDLAWGEDATIVVTGRILYADVVVVDNVASVSTTSPEDRSDNNSDAQQTLVSVQLPLAASSPGAPSAGTTSFGTQLALPRTGVDLDVLAMLAGLLVVAGVAVREVGRGGRPGGTQ